MTGWQSGPGIADLRPSLDIIQQSAASIRKNIVRPHDAALFIHLWIRTEHGCSLQAHTQRLQ